MKKVIKLILAVLLVAMLAAVGCLSVGADSVCEINGVGYATVSDAISAALEGDVITLKAEPTAPVKVERPVTIDTAGYELVWYSETQAPTVTDNVYTFAPTLDFTYIDWYVGHRQISAERLAYTVGSFPVYYGTRQYGDYTLADSDLTMTGIFDGEGNEVTLSTVTEVFEVIPSYYCRYVGDRPRFKVTAPDGTETIHYISTDLNTACYNAPSGSTITLLDDVFFPYFEEGAPSNCSIIVKAYNGKTLNFDFAGHTVISETKFIMFVAEGSMTVMVDDVATTKYAELNVYSSLPGAAVFLGSNSKPGDTTGGSLLSATEGTTINFGDYGEYSGRNISAYCANAANVYNGSTVTISGASIYRTFKDWVGFMHLRTSNATLNLVNARVFAVNRDIQIAFGTSAGKVSNSYFNATGTLFATLAIPDAAYSGTFIRYIHSGCGADFKDCAFYKIPYSVEKQTKTEGLPDPYITFDKNCSFDKLPNAYDRDLFDFDKVLSYAGGIPQQIYTNDITTDPVVYNSFLYDTEDAYVLKPASEKNIGGVVKFTSDTYQEDSCEIFWYYNGESVAEWWEVGVVPYPFAMNPKSNEFVECYVGDTTPVEDGMSYDVYVKRIFEVKVNFTLKDKLGINVYVPYHENVKLSKYVDRITVGAMTMSSSEIMENLKPVTIDGKEYYKVSFSYDYSKVPETLRVIVDCVGADDKATVFSDVNSLKIADYARYVLDGDYTDRDKDNIKGMLYKINDAYLDAGRTVPPSIIAIIDEKFPRS